MVAALIGLVKFLREMQVESALRWPTALCVMADVDKKSAVQPTLLAIAWPIFVEQSLHILIGTVDTFMVSHVSDGAGASLGVANQFVVLAPICFNFIGIEASVVIIHHVGANDRTGVPWNSVSDRNLLSQERSTCV